jgi:DNA-binding MarR family transcriptional regulator
MSATKNREKQIEEIFESLYVIKRKLSEGYSPRGKIDISISQWLVLRVVSQHTGIGVKEIASLLGITSSAATQLISCLVEKEYLIREGDSKDRRALKIKLSAKAKRKMARMRSKCVNSLSQLFGALNDEEFRMYCAINKKVVQGAQRK